LRTLTYWIRLVIKSLYGSIYRLSLPLLVHPPGRIYHGEFHTENRIAIYKFLGSWRERIHGKVLDVGVGSWSYPRQLLGKTCEYTSTDCFSHPNVDVVSDIHNLNLTFSPGYFDFVLCLDVLEHIQRPQEALQQIHTLLKDGGILLLTMPFNYPLHENQFSRDYWRFTSQGLHQLLVDQTGFRELEMTHHGHPNFPFGYQVSASK
jgi:SAM-dependent methyltransferase